MGVLEDYAYQQKLNAKKATPDPVGTPFGQAGTTSVEAYASPFSTTFGGTAPSTELDVARQYASSFSTAFGGTAPTFPGEVDTSGPVVPATGASIAENNRLNTIASKSANPSDKKDTTEKTLALDTFRNTLAFYFGREEVQKPWVNALYTVTSKYYNSGSTIDESINLSVQEARNNPELKTFADRFKGVYALQDRLAKGEAITVPTVADYFKSEAAMGDVVRQAGMGELATQEFLGGVIGLGKSVSEVATLISNTFNAIDNAPKALKSDLQSILKLGVSRTDIAKALLTGKEGAAELNKRIESISTLSAAKSQGITIDEATASDIASRGYDYNKSLSGMADVKRLERGQTLGRMSNIGFTQEDAIASTFQSSAAADEKIRRIEEEEKNRFAARSGRLASQNRSRDF